MWCGFRHVVLGHRPRSRQIAAHGTLCITCEVCSLAFQVGPHGDWVKYSYRSPLVLVPECDGVRIISNEKCEFLHRVPKSTVSTCHIQALVSSVCSSWADSSFAAQEDVFKIGSLEPAAILHDAMEFFENKSAKVTIYPVSIITLLLQADEHIRNIKARAALVGAVDGCIDAAVHEFDPQTQRWWDWAITIAWRIRWSCNELLICRSLLKAAAYGKCFCDYYNADNFVDNCKTLRCVADNVQWAKVSTPWRTRFYVVENPYCTLTPIGDFLLCDCVNAPLPSSHVKRRMH